MPASAVDEVKVATREVFLVPRVFVQADAELPLPPDEPDPGGQAARPPPQSESSVCSPPSV